MFGALEAIRYMLSGKERRRRLTESSVMGFSSTFCAPQAVMSILSDTRYAVYDAQSGVRRDKPSPLTHLGT